MNAMKQGWFSEINDLWPGVALSLEVNNILHQEKSKYQDILIVETKAHGKALMLDGIIQCTEHDEFSYQEMISFLPLCSHPNPEKVLIIGGGDGGVAREVAKHPSVKSIVQCEIDASVIKACRKYMPSMAKGFDNPKVELHVGDGFEFMKNHQNEFDVIITDSSDPVGPAESLYQQSYFELMKSALKQGGIVCSQGGTAWANLDHVLKTMDHCKKAFPVTSYGITSVPTYPTGQIGFVLGSLNNQTNFKEPSRILTDEEMEKMNLRYYSPDVHRAAFVAPRFIQKAILSGCIM